MAITNHERVGKALELLQAGSRPSSSASSRAMHQAQAAEAARRYLGDDRTVAQEAARRLGRGGAAQADVGGVERRLRPDARPRRALAGAGAARLSQQVGAPGAVLQRRRRPRARLDGAPAHRRLGAAGRRGRQDEDGAAPAHLRRAGARREAQGRRLADRGGGDGHAQALARGRDAARGRGERPLPAGGVRRRPLAGAPGRGLGRVPEPAGVLPPHLPHREPEAPARGRRAAPLRQGRRPGGAAPDQLRRRQDPLDAGALPPVLGGERRASWPAWTRCWPRRA